MRSYSTSTMIQYGILAIVSAILLTIMENVILVSLMSNVCLLSMFIVILIEARGEQKASVEELRKEFNGIGIYTYVMFVVILIANIVSMWFENNINFLQLIFVEMVLGISLILTIPVSKAWYANTTRRKN